MPRKGPIVKQSLPPDPIYGSVLLSKLVNKVMKDGKKSTAQKQVYEAFRLIEEKTKTNPLTVFQRAVENIKPRFEVRSRRVGGAAYQVPMQVRGDRQESLALKWIIIASRSKSNTEYHTFAEKLAAEIIDSFNEAGEAIAKKREIERIAESNKAFAHLRW